MAYPVKFFHSGMAGAPVVSNNWGDLTGLLDGCLVTGFNLKTIDGITSAAGVATASISGGHTYVVDQIVLISGCEQSAYNGEQRVTGITGNTFTFDVAGNPASPATTQGTITCKVAPLGFQIAFTGTNKRVYRSPNAMSTRPFLRVDNSLDPVWTTTYAKYAKVTMAENMTGIDTFVGARAPYDPVLPTKNEVGTGSGSSAVNGWYKWIHARIAGSNQTVDGGAGARSWVVVGDDRGFFIMLPRQSGHTVRSIHYFGDFASFKAGDAYPCLLTAVDDYNAAGSSSSSYPAINVNFEFTVDYVGKILLRDYTQLGNPVRAGFFTLNPANSQMVSGRTGTVPWPNGPDFSLQLWPVWIREESGHVRGQMPGLFFIPQSLPYSDLTVVEKVVNYAGRKFLLVCGANTTDTGTTDSTRVAFDITGPWR